MLLYLKKRIDSVINALNGIRAFISFETHAKLHVFSAIVVIVLSIILRISTIEWLFIILAIGLVIITEMINTATEKMVDMISSEYLPTAKFIKDVAAGAVLVASIMAVIIGLTIFLNYLL